MILELNLVKLPTFDSVVGTPLARKRMSVNNDTEALDGISKFIGENFEMIDGALSDKSLVSKLDSLTDLAIDDLYALKYHLVYSSGIDIWFWYVGEDEVNKNEVPEDTLEYTVVDRTAYQSLFIPMATRFAYEESSFKFTKMYEDIINTFGLFKSDLVEGMTNPIELQIQAMKPAEIGTGNIPPVLYAYTNGILKYMGKDLYLLSND